VWVAIQGGQQPGVASVKRRSSIRSVSRPICTAQSNWSQASQRQQFPGHTRADLPTAARRLLDDVHQALEVITRSSRSAH
jgi:hypothetical protein